MRTLSVDDDPKAMSALQFMLENYFPWVNVVGTASNVTDGRAAILQHQPELVFLDIEMPDGLGVDLMDRFRQREFDVVYVTAHEAYVLQALKQRAFDYLLKPIDLDDLQDTLNRIRERRPNPTPPAEPLPKLANRLAVPQKSGMAFVPVEEVMWLEADGAYTYIYTISGERHLTSYHLKHWESQLDPATFFRCHHARIVHLRYIKSLSAEGGYTATLQDGTHVEVSRRRYPDLQQAMLRYAGL